MLDHGTLETDQIIPEQALRHRMRHLLDRSWIPLITDKRSAAFPDLPCRSGERVVVAPRDSDGRSTLVQRLSDVLAESSASPRYEGDLS